MLRALARRLVVGYNRIVAESKPFWPAWEEEVREAVVAHPIEPPAPAAPPARSAVDAPTETTKRMRPKTAGVTHHGPLAAAGVTTPAAVSFPADFAAKAAACRAAAASR